MDANTITQTFVATRPKLEGILLEGATFARPNYSRLQFSLYRQVGNTERVVAEYRQDAATMEDNHRFFVPLTDTRSAGVHYRLRIAAIGATDQDSVTLGFAKGDPYPSGALAVNGSEQQADLAFRLVYARTQAPRTP